MALIMLKFVRIRQGMSIRKLSKISGVSKSQISNIEKGMSVPTLETICALAKGLGVKPEDLYLCE